MTGVTSEQELVTLPENLSSSQWLSGVPVARSLVVSVVFCRSLFVIYQKFEDTKYKSETVIRTEERADNSISKRYMSNTKTNNKHLCPFSLGHSFVCPFSNYEFHYPFFCSNSSSLRMEVYIKHFFSFLCSFVPTDVCCWFLPRNRE
jgi:hypothetical protein